MHPPLDRPHPDCDEPIAALKHCHQTAGWSKYAGACNDFKVQMDQCLRAEKKRLLEELNRDLPGRFQRQEEMVKTAFGKTETFSEYLQQDKEYRAAKKSATTTEAAS